MSDAVERPSIMEAAGATRQTRILMVSPPFPCGLGYIGDILLRLGVRIAPSRLPIWTCDGDRYHLTELGKKEFHRHFACAREQDEFIFPEPIEVIYEHRFDMINQPYDDLLLFVRDPIDAVFSHYKRYGYEALGLSFEQYLDRSIALPIHTRYRGLVMGPLEHYAVFCLFWMLAGDPAGVIHFEEAKMHGHAYLRALLHRLRITRSDSAIEAAVAGASFQRVSRQQQAGAWHQDNRRGLPFEWRERMDEAQWQTLVGREPLRSVLRLTGYARPALTIDQLMPRAADTLMTDIALASVDVTELVTTSTFVAWASTVGRMMTARAGRSPLPAEAWWLAENLDHAMALDTTLRLMARALNAAGKAPISWYLRFWLGFAAVLRDAAQNPRMRWFLSDLRTA